MLDLKNKNIVKIIFTAPGTEGISLAPAEDFVYASSVLENTVFKIDTKTLQVVQTGTTDRSPVRVLVTPDGQRLVINNSADGTVQVFDAASMTLIKRIKVGRQPIGIVVPDNHRAYVANMRDNTVSVIDLDKLEVMQDISTGKKPDGLAFIPAAH